MKSLPRIAVGLLILAMACPLVWAADPAIVFVDEAKAGAKAIMVMDVDGTNRREIFRTGKRFCDCGGPRLRPSISPDGDWVTYVKAEGDESLGYAIWKIPVAGGISQKLLCSQGPGHLIVPEAPQWSPDGTLIAAHTIDFFDGVASVIILPRDGIECGTLPEVIYGSDDSLTPFWQLYTGGVSWNQDGSQIALLEVDLEALVDYLTIVDRESAAVARYPVQWPPGFVGGNVDMELNGLDWQRSGTLDFAFNTGSENTTPAEIFWLLSVNEAGVAVATELAQGQSPTWSPDDSQLLVGASRYWGTPEDMTLVTISTGGTKLLGTGYDPDWRRSTPECDGNNPCGTGNVCCGGACIAPKCTSDELCEEIPPDVCTTDTCDPCSGCSHVFDENNDSSCEPASPECSGLGNRGKCNADPACHWDKRNRECVHN